MRRFERAAVLGYGTMGRGIAQVLASSGRAVTVYETDQERVDAGHAAVGDFLQEGVRRGKVSEQERADTLSRIRGTTDLADLAGSDLVIEAVVEQHDVKADVLPRVADAVGPNTVLASNTSALAVTDLAATVPHPERFAGLHFFNPAPLMSIVEVVRALQSAPDVLSDLENLCHDLGKSPAVVPDRPGFLVNRLLMPYLNDVVQAYDDGLASAEDLDTALELGLGYRVGPMRLLDMIGLDVHEHATASAHAQLHDSRFAPPPLLSRMVAAGYLGDKAGKGFRAGGGAGPDDAT
ncbi:3-hydroxybutyryl-CoA dehydrogenase [Lipingzhangella halophila]|uniref:3-hydroxybutyryl-CoA dehydrogenase n=1 Tax=Lipingzhangella halophila TaxID=1783352 RepID=A0A7W7RNK0_9ACTN|nr:3-hydroxyacyl-CoA dehydrogenase family protein [Lipingzhangella halophila]MBB4935298.1 3-hydroxybutyryl-CoA dehydrogenase [Lipingzhangella halophila]